MTSKEDGRKLITHVNHYKGKKSEEDKVSVLLEIHSNSYSLINKGCQLDENYIHF